MKSLLVLCLLGVSSSGLAAPQTPTSTIRPIDGVDRSLPNRGVYVENGIQYALQPVPIGYVEQQHTLSHTPAVTSYVSQPATYQVSQPATIRVQQPQIRVIQQQPQQIHLQQPAVAVHRPATIRVQQPSTLRIQQPAITTVQQPQTIRVQQPAVTTVQQPSTLRIQQPYQQSSYVNPIAILRLNSDVLYDGTFHYDYETENGIRAQADGNLKDAGTENEAQVMSGSYSYTAPDGTPITVNWYADDTGFHAQGDHLPTPPPIPDAIARGLEYIRSLPPSKEDQKYDQQYNNRQYNQQYQQQYRQ